jgi:tRNA (cmo5U34)-methyltransferase
MKRDDLFVRKETEIGGFNFGEKTAEVFDDMLDRSVPLYAELQRMIGEIAAEFAQDGSTIFDLGCSTGITMQTLMGAVKRDVRFVGVDYSDAMLEHARTRLEALPDRRWRLQNADLNQSFPFDNASVVVVNLVLQFVRPLYRDTLIRHIREGMTEGGCVILVEKVLGNDSLFNRTFIKFYYDMKKRNGYSEMEISKKREELENVLIPYRVEENYELLRKGGFSHIDMFYKWYNFCGILALK